MKHQSPATKLAKRIILGKNKPTPLLLFLCWFTIIWSVICAFFMFAFGAFELIKPSENAIAGIENFTPKFSFIYGSLHLISLLSAILMYRLKKIGFFLYFFSNIAMVVLPTFYLKEKVNYFLVAITLVLIGLFASQIKKMS